MIAKNILQLAVAKLQELTGSNVQVTYSKAPEQDGYLTLKKGENNLQIIIESKNNLRESHLPYLNETKLKLGKFLVVSNYISDNIKQRLRDKEIFYLDTSGNTYINTDNLYIFIQGLKEKNSEKVKVTKAFNATGLRVLYELLSNTDLYAANYRAIAQYANVALGSVAAIMNDLKELGYLIALDEHTRKMVKWKELLDRWVVEYGETLRPRLFEEKFRFLNSDLSWKSVKLNTNKTVWGGEPAAAILTNHLKPEKYILYTQENKGELMKNYRLVPDSGGDITVYKWFWNSLFYKHWALRKTTSAILTYADLMITNDSRNIETAVKIYEEHISYPD